MLDIRKQDGVSLVELLVATALGLFLIAGLLGFVFSNLSQNATIAKTTRFNNEMRGLMTLMTDDIRRSGGWGTSVNYLGATTVNPFRSITTPTVTPTNSCILYSYDSNSDGAQQAITALDERYGFMLAGNTVKMRNGSTTYSCTDSTEWEAVTDPNTIKITTLNFTLSSTTTPVTDIHTVAVRNVVITLTGVLTSDSKVTQTLTQTVRIENDDYN